MKMNYYFNIVDLSLRGFEAELFELGRLFGLPRLHFLLHKPCLYRGTSPIRKLPPP